jgi:hypothetical protein
VEEIRGSLNLIHLLVDGNGKEMEIELGSEQRIRGRGASNLKT